MKQKPCPLCGKPGTIWKTLLACCSSPSCTLNSFFGETKEWNRLPRRDPLQRQKDAVVKAAIMCYELCLIAAPQSELMFNSEIMLKAVGALQDASTKVLL